MKNIIILYVVVILVLIALLMLGVNRIDNLKDQLLDCQIQKETSIQELRFDLTGQYYFSDSIFGIELQVSDSSFQRNLIIPINLYDVISFQPEYSDQVVTRKLKEVICKK